MLVIIIISFIIIVLLVGRRSASVEPTGAITVNSAAGADEKQPPSNESTATVFQNLTTAQQISEWLNPLMNELTKDCATIQNQ